MGESRMYPDTMKIKEVFKWSKEFYPDMDTDYAGRLAEKFSLSLKKRVKELSTDYESVFQIIIALSCGAPILLLDEPVLGLDANFRDLFYRELLENYSSKPRTIVISTHLIEEAADVIENVIIIKNGEILLTDEVEHLLSIGYTITGPQNLVDDFTQGRNIIGADVLGGAFVCSAAGAPQAASPSAAIIASVTYSIFFIDASPSL